MKKTLACLLLSYICLGCVYAQKKYIQVPVQSKVSLSGKDLFDSIKYIPLQLWDDYEIHKEDKLFVTSRYFVVQCRESHALYLFYKNGMFHCKIRTKNIKTDAPEREIFPILDESNNRIAFKTFWNRVHLYDFDGNDKGEELTPCFAKQWMPISQNRILYSAYNMENVDNVLVRPIEEMAYIDDNRFSTPIDSLWTTGNRIVAYRDEFSNTRLFDRQNDTLINYLSPYRNAVCQISPRGIVNTWYLTPLEDTPVVSLTEDNGIGLESKAQAQAKGKSPSCRFFHQYGDYILFQLGYGGNSYDKNYVLQASTGLVADLERMTYSQKHFEYPLTCAIMNRNLNEFSNDSSGLYVLSFTDDLLNIQDKGNEKYLHKLNELKKGNGGRTTENHPLIVRLAIAK